MKELPLLIKSVAFGRCADTFDRKRIKWKFAFYGYRMENYDRKRKEQISYGLYQGDGCIYFN